MESLADVAREAEHEELLSDLLSTLMIVKESGYSVPAFWSNIEDIYYLEAVDTHLAFKLHRPHGEFSGGYDIQLNPAARGWHKIERVELILSALAWAEDMPASRLGCLGTASTVQANDRWVQLAMRQPIESLRLNRFEDRLACAICHGRIPTGSLTYTPHKQPCHSGCLDFLHHVMIPQLKAQRAAAAAPTPA